VAAPLRILLVSWEYPPVIEGGLGRHVFKLSEALAGDGHEVHVLTRGTVSDEPVTDVTVHRVEIPPFSLEMDAFMTWVAELNGRLTERGAQLLEEHSFDLVHSHDWMVAGAAERLAAAADAPWLVTVHATEFGRHNGWVHTHPQREIHLTERHMVRNARHVICCSAYMAGHVRRVFGVNDDHVSAIPNGIDPGGLVTQTSIDVAALRRHYAAPDELLVVMVGRLVHEKGFHLALDALADLDLAGVRFLVAGTGTAEADLHAQARRLGLDARGVFLGRVDDDLLYALYRMADVAVVPSLYEPFGIVPLEAMATGCPVLVANTGGLREVVAGSGAAVTVTSGDAEALTAALAGVLNDPVRRAEMRAAGLVHVARFDWSAVATRTAEVYESIAVARAEPIGV
jgi:glycogen(starch) synthase